VAADAAPELVGATEADSLGVLAGGQR